MNTLNRFLELQRTILRFCTTAKQGSAPAPPIKSSNHHFIGRKRLFSRFLSSAQHHCPLRNTRPLSSASLILFLIHTFLTATLAMPDTNKGLFRLSNPKAHRLHTSICAVANPLSFQSMAQRCGRSGRARCSCALQIISILCSVMPGHHVCFVFAPTLTLPLTALGGGQAI